MTEIQSTGMDVPPHVQCKKFIGARTEAAPLLLNVSISEFPLLWISAQSKEHRVKIKPPSGLVYHRLCMH